MKIDEKALEAAWANYLKTGTRPGWMESLLMAYEAAKTEQPDDCRNNCEAILELDRRCDMVATQAEKDAARGFLGPKHAARMAFDGYGGEPQVDGMFVSEHGTGNWIAPTLKTIGRFKQHQVISRRDWVGIVTMLEGFLKREMVSHTSAEHDLLTEIASFFAAGGDAVDYNYAAVRIEQLLKDAGWLAADVGVETP